MNFGIHILAHMFGSAEEQSLNTRAVQTGEIGMEAVADKAVQTMQARNTLFPRVVISIELQQLRFLLVRIFKVKNDCSAAYAVINATSAVLKLRYESIL